MLFLLAAVCVSSFFGFSSVWWEEKPIPSSPLVAQLSATDGEERDAAFQEVLKQDDVNFTRSLLKHPDSLLRGEAVLILSRRALGEDEIPAALAKERDWITAELAINVLTGRGIEIEKFPAVIERWHPNQTERITEILQELIRKMKEDGYSGNLKRIIGWKSSYARNTWMMGHDIDFLKIFYEGIPKEKIKEYESWLDGRLLRIGATVQPPIWNEGTGEKELAILSPYGNLIFVPLYEPGRGFILNYPTESKAAKYKARKILFDLWDSGGLNEAEKKLIQRIQSMRALDTVYDVKILNLTPEEHSLLGSLRLKELIRTGEEEGKSVVYPAWMGNLGGYGDLRANFGKKEVAHVKREKDGSQPYGFNISYDVTTEGGDWGGFWWKVDSVVLEKSIRFDFEFLEGEKETLEIEFSADEQMLGAVKVRLPHQRAGRMEIPAGKFSGTEIDQISIVFKKEFSHKGRIRFSNFSVTAPRGEKPLESKTGFQIAVKAGREKP